MDSIVSIIVPVYQCEKYLDACIQSIQSQTYQKIEILLVDDGSTDKSGEICDQYRTDKRVSVFHRTNHGVSQTRNFAIEKSKGDYLLFVDSDDTIHEEMVECLLSKIEENQAEAAISGIVHDYNDHSRVFPTDIVEKVVDGKTAVREVLINQIATAGPVCKLLKKESVKQLRFPEDLSVGEDAVYVIEALQRMNKVVFFTKPFYHYNHREDSIMSSKFGKRDLNLIEAYERIFELTSECDLKEEAMFRLIWSHFFVLDKAIGSRQQKNLEIRTVKKWIRSHFFSIIRNSYVGKNRKIALCALMIHLRLYSFIIQKK